MKIKNILVILICLAIAFALAGLSYFVTEKSEIDACKTVKTYHGWPFIYRIDFEVIEEICLGYGIGIKNKNNSGLYADALLFFIIVYTFSFFILRNKFNLKTSLFIVVLIIALGLGIYLYTSYWDWIKYIRK